MSESSFGRVVTQLPGSSITVRSITQTEFNLIATNGFGSSSPEESIEFIQQEIKAGRLVISSGSIRQKRDSTGCILN